MSEPLDFDTLPDSTLLTTEQAGRFLDLAPATLENHRYLGDRGPAFVKLGARRVRYRMADLRAYIARCTVTPT